MNGLFGGNSCTWVLILVVVFLLSRNCDNGCGCGISDRSCDNGCGCDYHGGCNCGC